MAENIEESFKDFVPSIARRRNEDPAYPVMRSRTDDFDRQDTIADHLLAATFSEMVEMASALVALLPPEAPTAFAMASALAQWATQRKASQ